MQPPRLPQTRVFRLLLPTSLLLMAFGASATLVPEDDGANLEDTRSMIAEWVETRRVYSEEMANWKIGREMLMQRAEVYQRDIADLKARTAETSASITEADTRRTELETERDALKAASVSLGDSIAALESRTLRLLDRVPPVLADRLRPLSARIPEPGSDTKVGLGERFQNVVGLLNELNKANRAITTATERRDFESGASAEVTVVYLGLGQAYYAAERGAVAGTGTAGPDGWVWSEAPAEADAIRRVIAILQNTEPAAYVGLPIRID